MSIINGTSKPTLQEVEGELKKNPGVGNSQITSAGNCGRINRMLQLDLEEDFDVDSELVVTHYEEGDKRLGHMYLKIPHGELADVEGPVIIDGALDQFAMETVTGDRSEQLDLSQIPMLVVATKSDPEFEFYSGESPVAKYLT